MQMYTPNSEDIRELSEGMRGAVKGDLSPQQSAEKTRKKEGWKDKTEETKNKKQKKT